MEKVRVMYGVEAAINMLRPGAKWDVTNGRFTRWEDPRPCPSWEEVVETMEKLKAFEDSVNTIWLPEQLEVLTKQMQNITDAINEST